MSIGADRLRQIFDEVMRLPGSSRGIDIGETCRLLAERAKAEAGPADYAAAMHQLEEIYIDQFIHTCMADPRFADGIRAGIARYI